jgi:outer membrane lipoprotein-sorting protein
MKRTGSILLTLALVSTTIPFSTRAQQPPPAAPSVHDVLQRIEAARQNLQTLEARFDQERQMGLFAQTLHAQGRLVVQRPDRVRWEVTTPTPGVFVVNGSRVAYRAGGSSASANQNQVGPLGAVLGDLASFLGGPLQPLERRYQLSVSSGANGATVLEAHPLTPELRNVVSTVRLQFASDLRVIQSIVMEEPGGDRTRIDVHDVQINSGHVAPNAFAI